MGRIARTAGIGIPALGLLLGTAGTVHADEQSFLDGLAAHGMTYGGAASMVIGLVSPAEAVQIGRMICDNIRFSGDPRAGFNMYMNASVPDYMIDVAQHELCPDTLGTTQ
ncbi:DUF732 domain-containing protein [Mycolicibacter virginiensis]|uniref:DUF732 domain-containing protein n=1 Tax=Mycolicibacter virginiensis TaxID=1795032 RepID=UPI001F03F11E|nr:DUF732 domain-containing protein [Mycolicibacter virginiensis]ULP48024.1 DUF732 domain-containing protein [Mycolicibacter virginiensis]